MRGADVARDGYSLRAVIDPPTRPDAPWLVFGNSLLTDTGLWDAQVAALRGRFGCLRYDQAGHGQSGLPPRQPDFDDLGADLLAVMDHAEVDRAIYVGVSMGVPTGLAAHRQQPGRFRAMVLVDGQARTAPGGAQAWIDRISWAQDHGMDAFARQTADRWLTSDAPDRLRARLRAMIAATPFDGFRSGATALQSYDYTDELPRIAVPALLLAGAQDGGLPASMAANLLPALADARMETIPDAGHVPCLEQPDMFNTALDAFLRDRIALKSEERE